jgi:hypothetical protein
MLNIKIDSEIGGSKGVFWIKLVLFDNKKIFCFYNPLAKCKVGLHINEPKAGEIVYRERERENMHLQHKK